MTAQLGFGVPMKISFNEALDKVVAALKAEGFGVLTRIDVKETFKEKLGVDFRPYAILGACNPPLSHKALSSDPEVGLMLPCNVIVDSGESGSCVVRIANPEAMLTFGELGDNPVLVEVAREARARLKRVAQSLKST